MSYVVFDFANVLWHAANSDHPVSWYEEVGVQADESRQMIV